MAAEQEATQIPLSVTVSSWSSLMYSFKKAIREFRYSPFVQVLSNFLFYLNGGIVGGVYIVLNHYNGLIQKGYGVLFLPGSKSVIPSFVASSVKDLAMLYRIWDGMLAVWLIAAVICVFVYSFGKSGFVTYIFALTALLLLLIAKIVLAPLLLLGGM